MGTQVDRGHGTCEHAKSICHTSRIDIKFVTGLVNYGKVSVVGRDVKWALSN